MSNDRVLIVDDAGFVREILTRICESIGVIVVAEAVDGEDAIIKTKQFRPSFIFMDLVMPKKNGLEAIKEIRAENPDIVIVACSTIDDDLLVGQAMELGCVDYIKKPFSRRVVIEKINKYSGITKENING